MKKLLSACFFFLPVFAFSQEEWELIHGSDDAFTIRHSYRRWRTDLDVSDPALLILRFFLQWMEEITGGITWSDIFPDFDNAFNNLQFVNRFVVWATENNGRILKSTEQGYTWELVQILPGFNNPVMHFFNENDAFISDGFTIDRALTNDAWSTYQYSIMYHYNWFPQLSFDKGLNGMASGNHNLLRTRDGGQNWERLNRGLSESRHFNLCRFAC